MMAVVVVGGHTRNIGKTTVTERILRSTADLCWTAMKITQFGHTICSANGKPCDCDTGDHTVAISEERNPASGTDTSRMLEAGARRVLWVRTRQGQLAEAIPRVRREIAGAPHTLIESNSVLRFLKPDLYIAVLDDSSSDFKQSALRYLDRADMLMTPDGHAPDASVWAHVSSSILRDKPLLPLSESNDAALTEAVRRACRA